MNLARAATVASKEWREMVRDRMFVLLAFLLPALWMLVFGYGLVLDVEEIPVVVLDRDHTSLSRDYVYRFVTSRYFDFKGSLIDDREVGQWLDSGKARVVVVIPEKFEERLLAGQPIAVQTLIDGTFPLRADITKGYVIAINGAFSGDLLEDYVARTRGLSREGADRLTRPIDLEVRYLYNEEVRSSWSTIPALVMFSLMLAPPLLTALGIVREKESGSIYNIYSATVGKAEYLAGKLAPYVLVSFVNAVVLWLLATLWFGVPFKGNVTLFLFSALLFVLTSTGIGLLVSIVVSTQIAALIVTMIIAIVPTTLFSGLIVPISSLSPGAWVQAHFFPGMYFTTIARGTFLKGVGLDVLWPDVLALALYAAALRLVGYRLFTKRPRS